MARTTAEFGSWISPIGTQLLTAKTVGLSEPCIQGENSFWLESRPWEKGRSALVTRDAQGRTRDILPKPINVRTRVHEYGGGSYLIHGDWVYFVAFDDQRIYRQSLSDARPLPEPITPEGPWRYADMCMDETRSQLICVREDHSEAHEEACNEVIAIALDKTDTPLTVLCSGNDFYSNPRLSPNSEKLSWLTWQHPNLPWDETECWLADIDASGQLSNAQCVAGGAGKQHSIFQPQWSPAGELYWVSDENNWWNIYRLRQGKVEQVTSLEAEFATPQWVFGMSTFGFMDNDTLLACFTQDGLWQLATIDTQNLNLNIIETPYVDISALHCQSGKAIFIGGAHKDFEEIVTYQSGQISTLVRAGDNPPAENNLSSAQAISFAVTEDESAHGFYYPPCNANFSAPENDLPPLIVLCHGGPTGATSSALSLKIQYWTSRGFAIFDINYRGSTGYGRRYRDRLKKNWGICDVEDVCAGARYLVEKKLAHPDKLAIKGGSAGGYTVLAALTFSDVFNAGASHYGVGDLESLAKDTHKFEARYLDQLIGPYPEQQEIYHARSPINSIDQLNCPVIFFQGLDDKVVPPNQAEAMVAALNAKHIPCAYVPFEGEGHGFRQGPNIKRALEGELYFYGQLFKFTPADAIEPLTIKNV
jgi:dipeptidyl aminopeptidase/acylaminoacyl peptidase